MTVNREFYNAYMNKYIKERYHTRMSSARESMGGKCAACGSLRDLEFDHINPADKEFTVTSTVGISQEKFDAELKKCQLLCKECHKKKHSARENHGTLSCYRYCKCELCKQAKRDYANEYNRTHVRKRDRK